MLIPGISRLTSGRNARRMTATALTVAAVLMVGGAGWLAAYPFYTDIRASHTQSKLKVVFESQSTKTAYQTGTLGEGSPLTRIVIGKIGTDAIVVEGTSLKALAAGAGHYRETPLPGEAGNVAIAGHRTMNGRPFSDLEKLTPGDRIELITPFARHIYEVVPPFDGHSNPWVTSPNDWRVIEQTTERMLTLTTCHPEGSSKTRMVARARHVSSEPIA